jgi:nickel-dependent lactate racemase
MVETAKMVDLDIKIDVIMNGRAEISGLFVGDVGAEFDEGVKMARNVYATKVPQDVDIVVANTYFKANEARLAMWLATTTVKAGGSVVLVANAPEGQVTHYLYGKFGKELGGTLYRGNRHNAKIGRLIIYSKYEMKDPCLQILDPDEQIWFNNWEEVLEELQKVHTSGARVAVFPYAEVQIPPHEIQ